MLFTILYSIILPVFVLVGLGFGLDRRLRFDMRTLADLNFYIFVPALVFVHLVQTELPMATLLAVGGFCVAHGAIMYVTGRLVFATHPALRQKETVLSLGTVFYNAGNYGIPLIVLAFGHEHLEVIAAVLIVQNFLSFTFGIGLLERNRRTGRMLVNLIRIPTIQAIGLAVIVRLTAVNWAAVEPLARPARFLADGLVPVALLTLGVQLSRARPRGMGVPMLAVTTLRLLVSPLVAVGMTALFGFQPPVASVLIVAAGLPVAVNVAILAGVYQKDADLASQAVFWSTMLSAVTISVLLLWVQPR